MENSPDYRVFIVGDSYMGPHELLSPYGSIEFREESLSRVRVDLVEADPSLKNDLTKFRKEIINCLENNEILSEKIIEDFLNDINYLKAMLLVMKGESTNAFKYLPKLSFGKAF